MPSITLMMSAILRELALMVSMLRTTWPTTSPPRVPHRTRWTRAGWPGGPSRRFATPCRSGPPASWLRFAGCARSVRCAGSGPGFARGHLGLATRMESAVWLIRPPGCAGAPCMAAMASSSRPVSSWIRTSTCEVRSPRQCARPPPPRGQWGVMLAVMRWAITTNQQHQQLPPTRAPGAVFVSWFVDQLPSLARQAVSRRGRSAPAWRSRCISGLDGQKIAQQSLWQA